MSVSRSNRASYVSRWRNATAVILSGVLLGAGVVAMSTTSSAASTPCSTSWTNVHGGDWSDAANWTHGEPDGNADACITLSGTYTVTVDSFDNEARSLNLGATDGTQTLLIEGNCNDFQSVLTLGTDSLIGLNGSVVLSSTGCGGGQLLESAGTLTNNGEIETQPGVYSYIGGNLVNNGFINLDGPGEFAGGFVTNAGTISVADGVTFAVDFSTVLTNNRSIDAAGSGLLLFGTGSTYSQGTGRLRGTAPVVIDGGRVDYTGRGAGTVTIHGENSIVSGDLGAHQTLALLTVCGGPNSYLTATGDWTNRGTIVLNPCSGFGDLTTLGTLTNLGTVRADGIDASEVALSGRFVNRGLVTVGDDVVLDVQGPQFVNTADGTIAVDIASPSEHGVLWLGFSGRPTPLALDGTLAISTIGNYWPTSPATFFTIFGGKRTGTFAKVTGRKKPGHNIVFHAAYTADGVNLNAS